MAYNNNEYKVYGAIGCFSTIAQVISDVPVDRIDYTSGSMFANILPGQCQAFLISPTEFTWFIEEREIIHAEPDSPLGTPLVTFGSKKVYPAKVTGLNLPLIENIFDNDKTSVTMRWRNELVRYGNASNTYEYYTKNLRPGFGEVIWSDLERPLNEVTVLKNSLGLPELSAYPSSEENCLTGPLGRLMSIASYVNPELAAKYEKSNKKKKSLNEQTYQDPPEYPPYTPYEDNSGY